jgi:hypothetical protein
MPSSARSILAVSIAACLLLGAVSRADNITWHTGLADGEKIAREEGKPIILLFTGTQWCEVCQILEQNVLSKPEFAAYVKDRVVLVKAEYDTAFFDEDGHPAHTPRQQALIDLALKYDVNVGQPNDHGLNGYPSVFILAPDGTKLGEVNTNINAAQAGIGPFLKDMARALDDAQKKLAARTSDSKPSPTTQPTGETSPPK